MTEVQKESTDFNETLSTFVRQMYKDQSVGFLPLLGKFFFSISLR